MARSERVVSAEMMAVAGAARAAAVAVVSFALLFIVSTQFESIRAHSPWAEDPYDAVISVASLMLPLVVTVTLMRLRHRNGPIPPATIRNVLRGIAVALGLVWATVGACVAALALRARLETWGPWLGWLTSLVSVTLLSAAAATWAYVRASKRAARYLHAANLVEQGSQLDPDAIDDVATLIADVGNALANFAPRLGHRLAETGRGLNKAMSSTWGPRKHQGIWCFGVALVFGTGFSAWHLISEGAPSSWPDTLGVGAVLTAVAAVIVVASYASLGRYLRLIRPERERATPPRRDYRELEA